VERFVGQPVRELDPDEVLQLQGEVTGKGEEEQPNGSSWPDPWQGVSVHNHQGELARQLP
jgi:hypothetical protein